MPMPSGADRPRARRWLARAGRLIPLVGLLLAWTLLVSPRPGWGAPLTQAELGAAILAPYALGAPVNDRGVWHLLNTGGMPVGYVFETEPLAPLPGFSGAPINLLVMLDLDGRFLDVRLLSHNEPIFVSGLGEAPFRRFFEQYRGLSIKTPLVIGTPHAGEKAGGALVYLDGIAKATASVRVAHESILAATLAVARNKMQGLAAGLSVGPPVAPDPEARAPLSFAELQARGLVTRLTIDNAALERAFAGSLWAEDDPEARANPDGLYLDLWVVDLGPPAVAAAILDAESLRALRQYRQIAPDDEPVLVIDTGRHGLVSPSFTRSTAPDLLTARQDALPLALRDADLPIGFNETVPSAWRHAAAQGLASGAEQGVAMILRIDRRLGFDPTKPWSLDVHARRSHGLFWPEIGSVTFTAAPTTDPALFIRAAAPPPPRPPWLAALHDRALELMGLGAMLTALMIVLYFGQSALAGHRRFGGLRLVVLGFTLVGIGWLGQGQLSIVTVLAVLRAVLDDGSLAFLLYDPFSLLIWAATLIGFVLWGRGLFCGWLCPFGALQEFIDRLGRWLRLPRLEPGPRWARRLSYGKYLVLAGLIGLFFFAPRTLDTAVEVEPFKTTLTVYFQRDWPYVAYAGMWLGLALFTFKGFCRFVCPLGAVMALGGLLRRRDWIARRSACGSPCQLCRVRCRYGAITPAGRVDYADCFQCLDCVTIHDDPATCVPLVLAARRGRRG